MHYVMTNNLPQSTRRRAFHEQKWLRRRPTSLSAPACHHRDETNPN